MKILISGSHGLVGQALINFVSNDGHEIIRLVRRSSSAESSQVGWDPERGTIDGEQLEGLDAVVHLAGESIASGRWTDSKKRKIRESRVRGTELLSRTLGALSKPPPVFVSASAIGYYGNRGDEILTEQSPPGHDFLSQVCIEWERATEPAMGKGIRVALTRFGIILDKKGGALAKMLAPFRMGVGGKLGDGKQWMSWVALNDVVRALSTVMFDKTLAGPVNIVAPNPVRNAEFTRTLGKVLSRPTLFPIPTFGIRAAFGEMADALLLSSQRVEPTRLSETGFQFQFPDLEGALRHLLKN